MSTIELIAHRGDSAHAPENTLPAFERAVAAGCDWIETDLTLARGEEVVLCHDLTLRRRAGRRERLVDLSAARLAAVDVSTGFPDFPATGIPRLEEALEGVGRQVPLYLELKSRGGGRRDRRNLALLRRTLQLVPRTARHALASFDPGLVRGALEEGRRAVLILKDPAALDRLRPSERAKLFAVSVRWDVLEPRLVGRVARSGARLWCWTVDGEEAMARARDRGAQGLCCNDVPLARRILDRWALEGRA